MTEQAHVPHMTRHEGSRDESIKENSGNLAQGGNANVYDRFGAYAGLLAAILSAFALGYAVNTPRVYEAKLDALKESNARLSENYRDAEEQRQLLLMEIKGFKSALLAHGIRDTNPHLPGEAN